MCYEPIWLFLEFFEQPGIGCTPYSLYTEHWYMKAANNHIGQTPTMSFTNNSQVVFHYMNVTKLVIKLVIEFDSNSACEETARRRE